MKKLFVVCAVLAMACGVQATVYNDSTGDIDPGIATGNGTLDIVKMEVTHTSSDVIFALTVNGNVGTTDWGKFMIGIATLQTLGTTAATGNGWGRPINLITNVGATAYGMNYWVGTWVDAGGGSQLWSYDNGSSTWSGPAALTDFRFVAGAQSVISCYVSRTAIGLSGAGSFAFDAYSSGGGGTDSAVDALANPNVSITDWDGPYTSDQPELYTYVIPEPATLSLLGLGVLAVARRLRRS